MGNLDNESKKIAVLIPVYNERYLVGTLIERVLKAPLPHGYGREIVIVDDCSNDGTSEILQVLARDAPEIRIFRQDSNQ